LQVNTHQANLRSEPGLEGSVVAVVKAGENVQAEAYRNRYVRVRTANGKVGWVYGPAQNWSEAQITAAVRSGPGAAPAQPAPQPVARPAAVTAPVAKAPAVAPRVVATPPAPTPVAPSPPAATSMPVPSYSVSLADLGQRHGQYFEGAHATHSATWYFPLPLDGVARSGVFRLHYEASEMVDAPSLLRVDINDRPVRVRQLNADKSSGWLEIPLQSSDLDRDSVKITVKATIISNEDRCFDERRMGLLFLHIQPDSSIDVALSGRGGSLAAVWSTLPEQVRVHVPQPIDEAAYATFLESAVLLRHMHRKVQVVGDRAAADVVIGSQAELAAAYPFASVEAQSEAGWVALAARADGGRVVLLSDRTRPQLLTRAIRPWLNLLKAPAYRDVVTAATRPAREAPNEVDLLHAGLDDTQYVSRTVQWSLFLNEPLVSAGKRLESLRLNVVSAPATENATLMLHVYLNGVLQESARLNADGKPQTLQFGLTKSAQRAGANRLALVVQRAAPEGDCRAIVQTFPVQLLPGSVLELADDDTPPRRFNDLRGLFAQLPEIWVTEGHLGNLAREADLLAGLFANHDVPLERSRLRVLKRGQAFEPKGAFVLIGDAGQKMDHAGVYLDRGAVRVVDAQDKVLLGLDSLPRITLAQIVEQGGQHGLWLAPAREGALPPANEFFLDQGDVAFADGKGILLTLDARLGRVSRVEYPDYRSWFDIAGRYRFWLIALGWTLLALALAVVYRKSRQHAAASE